MSGISFGVKIDAKVSAALEAARKKIADVKAKIEGINKTKLNPKVAEGISKLKEKFGELGGKLNEQISQIPVVGEALSGLLTKMGPVGVAIAAVTVAVIGLGKHFFSLAEEFIKVNKLFGEFEKNGSKIDILAAKSKALAKTFEYTDEEISNATKSISKTFGIDSVAAMEKLEKATIAAGKKLPLEDITEFGTQIKAIGGDADSLLSTLAISSKNNLFSNKGLDALKEGGLRLREMSDATKELLKNTGNADISKQLKKGTITQEQAIKKIFSNLDKLSTKNQQELISGILGGAGEDLGKAGIEAIAKFSGGLDSLIDKNSEIVKENQERLKLEEELATVQGKNAKAFIPIVKAWNKIKIQGQIIFEKIITPISELFGDIWNAAKELYNVLSKIWLVTAPLKIIFGAIIGIFKIGIGLLRGYFQIITSLLKGVQKLASFLKEIFIKLFDKIFGEGALDKVKEFFGKIKDYIVEVFTGIGDFFSRLWESINLGLQGNAKAAMQVWLKAKSSLNTPGTVTEEEKKSVDDKLKIQSDKNVEDAAKGATSEVKNITLNLEALQKIGVQNLNNSKDVGDLGNDLTQVLLQVANNVNQVGNN